MLTVFAPECVLLPKESSSKCFLQIQWNKKTFQLYNGEWCWNSKFIFEKATILKMLGWYRVRVVLLTCGGLRGRCKWEICKYILMYKEDKPADKRLVLTHVALSYRITDIRYQPQDCIVAIYFRTEKMALAQQHYPTTYTLDSRTDMGRWWVLVGIG